MSLSYEILLQLGDEAVICLAFSTSGSKVAAITSSGSINVWDVATRKRYYPLPRLPSVEESCISWLDDATFICGFMDGSLLTGYVDPDGVKAVDIQRIKVSNSPILELSFNRTAGLLAIGDRDGAVRIWMKGEESLHKRPSQWVYIKALDLPEGTNFPVEYEKIISLSWLIDNPKEILVAYMSKGLIIWDTEGIVIKRSLKLKSGRKICKGTLCSSINKFAAINNLHSIDIYDIHSGETWSPSSLERVYAIKSIPMGTGFIAGGLGRSELVDVVGTCIGQVFCKDERDTSKINAIDVQENDVDGTLMVVMASSTTLQIWTMQPVGAEMKAIETKNGWNTTEANHEEASTSSLVTLFSFFSGRR